MTKTIKNPAVIINATSGSTSDISDEVATTLGAHGCATNSIVFVEAKDLDGAIQSAIETKSEVIITYGGDGTSLSAAIAASAADIPIVPLPGGTMNVLPKALYGTDVWQDVLDIALSTGQPRWIPAGIIGEHMFLVAAIIGTSARIGNVREALRGMEIVKAAKLAIDAVSDIKPDATFDYTLDDDRVFKDIANLLTVTCPGMNDYASSDTEFDVAAINAEGYGDLAGIGLSAITSSWRDDQSAAINNASKVTMSGIRKLDMLLDGEFHTALLPADITLKEKGVKVLAP